MDIKFNHYLVILCILHKLVKVSVATLNDTDTDQSTTTTVATTAKERDKVFGNPFWLGFAVIFFISLVFVAVPVALAIGIYKFRKEARKRGHFKHKCQVYRAPEPRQETDYEIFTTHRESSQGEVNVATHRESSQGEVNVAYNDST